MSATHPAPCVEQVVVRRFQPGDESAFQALNEEWINRYFRIEEKDRTAFRDPFTTVIARGGFIFIATAEGQSGDVARCCA